MLRNCVEVCILSTEQMNHSDFLYPGEYNINSTNIMKSSEQMVVCAYDKIAQRINILENSEIGYYPPVVIFIGDESLHIDGMCEKNLINTVFIHIGKGVVQSDFGLENLEIFNISTMSIAEQFNISTILLYDCGRYKPEHCDYGRGGYTYDDMVENFHFGSRQIRDYLKKVEAGESDNKDIITELDVDMEQLLADLAGD